MGSWFSNFHIRKSSSVNSDSVGSQICKLMAEQQFVPSSESEYDCAFALIDDSESAWISLYSDFFSFQEPGVFQRLANPLSAAFDTDVLGIACFDSDYLFLNLINQSEGLDAWASTGHSPGLGLGRRRKLSSWKNKVMDFAGFKACFKNDYICAEEILTELQPHLGLPWELAQTDYEYLSEFSLDRKARYLYFKSANSSDPKEPTKFRLISCSLMPDEIGKRSHITVLNEGEASLGFSVFFIGSFVEHDEITFSDVCVLRRDSPEVDRMAQEMEKLQLPDGRWAFRYRFPSYKIPAKVSDELPPIKKQREIEKREITVRYVPHGNPRKVLDIMVAIIPFKNPSGGRVFNLWKFRYGSKAEFIREYNRELRENSFFRNPEKLLLNEDDYDLD